MIRLTEGEWAILEVLWSGERFPLGEIVSALRPKMNWRRNTVHTYLTRMESKGLVKIHRETEPHQYAAPLYTLSSSCFRSCWAHASRLTAAAY